MAFTAKDVQELRERTGVGMMDCKKALTAADGDFDKAVEILREKGLAAAEKKAGRIAAEGMVYAAVSEDGTAGAVVEVNSETDFVARNENFQKFTADIANVILTCAPADLSELGTLKYPGSDMTVSDMFKEKVLTIGENIQLRRFVRYPDNVNFAYIHMGGKIGVLLNMVVSDNIKGNETVNELGKDICMQIAAMRPTYIRREDVPQAEVEKEKEILKVQVMNEGKPAQVAERIVAGKINKYYEDICLIEQAFVKENKLTVAKHVAEIAKNLDGEINIKAFTRYEKGEGIEKRSDNFADEIAKMVNK